ncbi:MAG TPA: phosphatase PAP2 family protein [Chloroflexota bacterium]|nr:phosphatase PAP2 family protein [Chloroflexota bacterium]
MDSQLALSVNQWLAAHPQVAPLVVVCAQAAIYLVPLALVALWLWPGRDQPLLRQAVLAGCVAFVIALGLALVLGHLVYRPRPFVALSVQPLFAHSASSSFPSDHALLGAALAGPLLWRRPREGVWLMLVVVLVGAARVAAGVHYLSDVLGSLALAAVPTIIALVLVPWAIDRLPAPLVAAAGLRPAAGHGVRTG